MTEMLAPAKINLFLLVGARRPDGYHPVCSLMEKVSLFDRLRLEAAAAPGMMLAGEGLPPGINTVETAARLLQAELQQKPQLRGTFELLKEIPVAAGLAGGSSDAAAALKLLVSFFDLKANKEQLMRIARKVGADVPFFLQPGPCLAEGVGEELSEVDLPFDYAVVLVTPRVELATASVYQQYDLMCLEQAGSFEERSRRLCPGAAPISNLETLSSLLANDLELPAIFLCPEIAGIKAELLAAGALGALMSGSGPSVYGLFAGENEANAAAGLMTAPGRRVWVVVPVR